jgi:hypothetical protein
MTSSACGDAADDAEADRERSERADEGQIGGSDRCCAAECCDRDESCEEAGAFDLEPLNGRVPEDEAGAGHECGQVDERRCLAQGRSRKPGARVEAETGGQLSTKPGHSKAHGGPAHGPGRRTTKR